MEENDSKNQGTTPYAAIMPQISSHISLVHERPSQKFFEAEGSVENLTYEQLLRLQYLPHKPIIMQPVCKYRACKSHIKQEEKNHFNHKIGRTESECESEIHETRIQEDTFDDDNITKVLDETLSKVIKQMCMSETGRLNIGEIKHDSDNDDKNKGIEPAAQLLEQSMKKMAETVLQGATGEVKSSDVDENDTVPENAEDPEAYDNDFESSGTDAESGEFQVCFLGFISSK